MSEACKGIKEPRNDRMQLANHFLKGPRSSAFQSVDRGATVESIMEKKRVDQQVENKYNPSFKYVEGNKQKCILKWAVPDKEYQFFYSNDLQFKHRIDMEIEKETSDNRIKALKKLYFDYRNKATFKRNDKLLSALSVHKRSLSSMKGNMSSRSKLSLR
mmetsp:Transcript_22959/g.35410  ORF Transcript_22959/g.35410 Transcript_22959/m.35410 type:complete len:159 (-) Transcript_22959:1603-2079(-)